MRPQQRSCQIPPFPGITMQRLSLRTGRAGAVEVVDFSCSFQMLAFNCQLVLQRVETMQGHILMFLGWHNAGRWRWPSAPCRCC